MFINKPRFIQPKELKIFKYKEGNALILYKYLSPVLFDESEWCKYCLLYREGNGVSYAYTYIYI